MKQTLTYLIFCAMLFAQFTLQAQSSVQAEQIKQVTEKNLLEQTQNAQKSKPGQTHSSSRVGFPDDFCSGATVIPVITSTVCGTTVGYTTDLPTGGLGCNPNSYGEADEYDASKWYTFTGNGELIDLYFDSYSGWDPEVNVYTNNCSEPLCVTGDDDGGDGLDAHVAFESVCGQVYFLQVHDCCGRENAFCFVMTTTPGCGLYCPSSGSGAVGNKFIKQVKMTASPSNVVLINNISNNNGGYADFTSPTANVTANSQYKLTLYPSLLPSNNPIFRWKVWIDYNNDGDFTDAGENVASVSATGNVSTPNFTIPATAVTGTPLRMRISMKMGTQYSTPCETGFNGEVEDYTIQVSGNNALIIKDGAPWSVSDQLPEALNTATFEGFTIAPNPSNGQFYLHLNSKLNTDAELQIMDSKGQNIYNQMIQANGQLMVPYTGSLLTTGLYFVRIANAEMQSKIEKLVIKN